MNAQRYRTKSNTVSVDYSEKRDRVISVTRTSQKKEEGICAVMDAQVAVGQTGFLQGQWPQRSSRLEALPAWER